MIVIILMMQENQVPPILDLKFVYWECVNQKYDSSYHTQTTTNNQRVSKH